jgi:hypothetical protein
MTLRLSTGLRNKLAGINPEKVANGEFTTDTDPPPSWTAATAVLTTEANGQSGNCMRVTESGGASAGKAYQDITVKTGHLYRFRGYFKKGTADNGKFMIGTTVSEAEYYDSGNLSDADWTLYEKYFVALGTVVRITCQSNDATIGEYSDFDTISLKSMARSIQDIFLNGEIRIYNGAQPALASYVPTPGSTLLVTIKKNGTDGISFDDAVAGILSKAAAESWQGDCVAAGTAGWFRLQTEGDLGTQNDEDERIDGAVAAVSGGQLNFTSTIFAIGATERITTFAITVPAA